MTGPYDRVAVVADVHGNPWALRAVLSEVRRASVDLIVDCGDLLLGPCPAEAADELLGFGVPVLSIRGNTDRILADAFDGRWDEVPDRAGAMTAWAAPRLRPPDRRRIGTLPLIAEIEVLGLGRVACFHATPRSDDEIVLPNSDEERVQGLLAPLEAPVALYGHVHLQYDRRLGDRRLVNPGSVGMPFDGVSAAWLLLGPGIELRRTDYDAEAAAEEAHRQFAGSAEGRVIAEAFAHTILRPPGRDAMLETLAPAEARPFDSLAARSRLHRLDDEVPQPS